MKLDALAAAVLATATAAAPADARSFMAAGPEFARICKLVAVYPSLVTVPAQSRSGVDAVGSMLGGCAFQLVPQVTLVYAKDCYPLPDDHGGRPQLPEPAELTAWTTEYLTESQTILDAVADAVVAGTYGGDCSLVSLGPVVWTGPRSGVATFQAPISVRSF